MFVGVCDGGGDSCWYKILKLVSLKHFQNEKKTSLYLIVNHYIVGLGSFIYAKRIRWTEEWKRLAVLCALCEVKGSGWLPNIGLGSSLYSDSRVLFSRESWQLCNNSRNLKRNSVGAIISLILIGKQPITGMSVRLFPCNFSRLKFSAELEFVGTL